MTPRQFFRELPLFLLTGSLFIAAQSIAELIG